jgi:F-box-like
VTIDTLPDIALLEIFDFYVAQAPDPPIYNRETWITLAHVCRKWRDIVFASPRRLNLRLLVTPMSSVGLMLDTWPPLLIDIWGFELGGWGMDTIIAALEHDDRIRQIELFDSSSFHMELALEAMRKPFPELMSLSLQFFDEEPNQVTVTWPAIPDSFLGESVPRLQSLRLISIPFPLPALQKLLLSATDLVKIRIWKVPNSWYISPKEVITCLSTLTRLEEFELGFQSRDDWGSRRLPPSILSTRCVLPALTSLQFKGVYEYMEDLMARIDAPQLDNLKLFLFDQPVLAAPQLAQLVGRTPRFKALNELHVLFDQRGIFVLLPCTPRRGLQIGIFRGSYGAQYSALVELCTSESSFLRNLIPTVKHLYTFESRSLMYWLENTESSQWLELLHPFTAVKDLYLSKEFALYIVPALLGSVGEGKTEVLPALRNLFLERIPSPGPVEEISRQFVAARQLSSHQIAIFYWDVKRDKTDKMFDHEDGL